MIQSISQIELFDHFIRIIIIIIILWQYSRVQLFAFDRNTWKICWNTVVKDDPKAPFSMVVREGASPFPRLLHFTFVQYLIMLSVKQMRNQVPFFESLVWLDLG